MSVARLVSLAILLFLISPFLILIFHFHQTSLPDFGEAFWALKNTFYQAIGSALIAGVMGLGISLGLNGIQKRIQFVEYLLYLPSFLPPLFLILICMSWIDPFPSGIVAIVFIQSLSYAGLLGVEFSRLFRDKVGAISEVGYVLGFSKSQFLFQVLRMLKRDFLGLLFLVFISCFASFAIPLAVGGGRGTTLEVLIYEKIRISGNFSEALFLSLLQSLLLISFVMLLRRRFVQRKNIETRSLTLLSWPFLKGAVLLYIGSYVFGFLADIPSGWSQLFRIQGLSQAILEVLPLSIVLSLGVGFVIYIFVMALAFASREKWIHKFIFSYVTPSTALIGFSYLYLGMSSELMSYLLFCLGFVLLSVCSLYRMGVAPVLGGLESQQIVGMALGAGDFLIARRITWPQIHQVALKMSGVGAVWALGDFAFSKIIFSRDVTLGLIVEGLMTSYRLGAAQALMSLILFLGGLIYLFFRGVGYVSRS